MNITPLRVYAYARPEEKLNFGDDMSPAIVGHVTGRQVIKTGWENAEVFGIGSILQQVLRRKSMVRMLPTVLRRRPVVWGAGLIGPQSVRITHHLRFLSVRGPHTSAALRLGSLPFGDPGLLAREVVEPIEKTHSLGIIPHYTEASRPGVRALADAFAHSTVIDVEQDWRKVLQQISACEAIVSSSLHGLIVADSYCIPNTRVSFSENGVLTDFKFRDYAEGVGRLDGCALATDPALAAKAVLETSFSYADRVDIACQGLYASGAKITQMI